MCMVLKLFCFVSEPHLSLCSVILPRKPHGVVGIEPGSTVCQAGKHPTSILLLQPVKLFNLVSDAPPTMTPMSRNAGISLLLEESYSLLLKMLPALDSLKFLLLDISFTCMGHIYWFPGAFLFPLHLGTVIYSISIYS